ncbi:MAG: alpha/beta hydrolase [Leptospiraceae bacterium]|nr:alpha/beta hydrolase [Leptospiraceae bacterium]
MKKIGFEQEKISVEEFDLKINAGTLRVFKKEQEDYKDKPYLIFLHDSLGCIALWKDFPEKLASIVKCNFLVYDRIGYGKSSPFKNKKRNNFYLEIEADRLLEVINSLSIAKSILFGHSDGGSIALIAAAKSKDQFSGIVTEGAHVFVEEITKNGILEAQKAYQTTKLKSILEKYHFDKTDDVFNMWAKTWLSVEFSTWNIEHYLPKIECPVLVIQGELDEYGTEKQVNSIASKVKGRAQKLLIPNVKHTPHKEVPEVVCEATTKFIYSLNAI